MYYRYIHTSILMKRKNVLEMRQSTGKIFINARQIPGRNDDDDDKNVSNAIQIGLEFEYSSDGW